MLVLNLKEKIRSQEKIWREKKNKYFIRINVEINIWNTGNVDIRYMIKCWNKLECLRIMTVVKYGNTVYMLQSISDINGCLGDQASRKKIRRIVRDCK